MAGKNFNLTCESTKTILEHICSRLRLLISNDLSRIFDIDGFLVKEVNSPGEGLVNRLYLKCLFFDEEGHLCGDFQTRRHDGDGFIWGRELSFLNSEDLKRILGLLQSFEIPDDEKNRRDLKWGFNGISSFLKNQRRHSSVSHHV